MRALLSALAAAATVWAALPADAQGRLQRIAFCSERSAGELRAAQALETWLKPLRIELRPGGACNRARPGEIAARFELRRARPFLVAVLPSGARIDREVPWLTRLEAPLSRLAVANRLSEFSLLVQGVVAEYELSLPAGAASAPAAPEPAPPPPKEPPRAEPGQAAPTEPEPAAAAEAAAPSAPPIASAPAAEPPPAVEAAAPVVAPPPETPEPVPPRPLPTLPIEPHVARPVLSASAFAAFRWRSPSVNGLEVGASAGWQRLRLRVAYDSEAIWNLSRRRVAVSAWALAGGWSFALLRGDRLESSLDLFGLGEQVAVRRTDVVGAATRRVWDFGLAAGPMAAFRIAGPVRAGASLDLALLPTAHRVQIPDGPSGDLGLFSARATFFVAVSDP